MRSSHTPLNNSFKQLIKEKRLENCREMNVRKEYRRFVCLFALFDFKNTKLR